MEFFSDITPIAKYLKKGACHSGDRVAWLEVEE